MQTNLISKGNVKLLEAPNINSTGLAIAYFSTRKGGISTGENGEMNLNLFKPNDRENSDENFKIFCSSIGIDPQSLVLGREKHTANIRIVDRDFCKTDFFAKGDENIYEYFDAQITNDNEVTLFVYSSDCSVFLFFDPVKKVIATTHAGWKGSLNGIIPKTISKMTEYFDVNPADLFVAVGPNIKQCCFEVDKPVCDEFLSYDNEFKKYIVEKNDKFHIDLDGINTELIVKSGIKPENIANNTHCTMCEEEMFHSYRRCKGNNGVNGAVIKLL
ncbi:MAG: peptidoglycan editing factor PgeF [Oscillospiraceae bacterium]|jgi:YfiH family protein|nr:peptidoglycan editing factor PgeF [Oscillospiraceae bacterium]